MITLTTTIQEITLQAYTFGVYNLMQDDLNMSRDEIFNTFEAWGHEFEETHEGYEWNGDYYDEIDMFIQRKERSIRARLGKEELKFKPGQHVTCIDVRNASSVGYLGTHHQVYDYIKHPEFLKHTADGEVLYPCASENGHITWFYGDELK